METLETLLLTGFVMGSVVVIYCAGRMDLLGEVLRRMNAWTERHR